VKSYRMFADENGDSHFEDRAVEMTPVEYAPPAPAFDVSEPIDAQRYIQVRFPIHWTSELHPTPRRQLFVVLTGTFEGETSLGATIVLRPGDQVMMEDTTGKGHAARNIGDEDVHGLMIHLDQ
jgi:hypothetical protein